MAEQRVKIEGTNDLDVSYALAYLAGFRKGTLVTPRYPGKQGYREVMVFHKDTIAKDPDLFLLTQSPDIVVSALLNSEYLIDFKKEKVDPALKKLD
ncbi:MAG: hypothetical protein IB618_00515 [Candidatus Pacearchaeota archaeon]|nr:MAG: hypothetical protein IB618_00515 [Candidatus Pacearchaeota archaeon]